MTGQDNTSQERERERERQQYRTFGRDTTGLFQTKDKETKDDDKWHSWQGQTSRRTTQYGRWHRGQDSKTGRHGWLRCNFIQWLLLLFEESYCFFSSTFLSLTEVSIGVVERDLKNPLKDRFFLQPKAILSEKPWCPCPWWLFLNDRYNKQTF